MNSAHFKKMQQEFPQYLAATPKIVSRQVDGGRLGRDGRDHRRLDGGDPATHPSISIFEMIKVGIGPSSSHTMGPWIAAGLFLDRIRAAGGALAEVVEVQVHLYGSLAKTGIGHGTDVAVMLGLAGGADYTTIDTTTIADRVAEFDRGGIAAGRDASGAFRRGGEHLQFHRDRTLPGHANGMRMAARFGGRDGGRLGVLLRRRRVRRVRRAGGSLRCGPGAVPDRRRSRHLGTCATEGDLPGSPIWCSPTSRRTGPGRRPWRRPNTCGPRSLPRCIAGVSRTGTLPGGLNVTRRASGLCVRLLGGGSGHPRGPDRRGARDAPGFPHCEPVDLLCRAGGERGERVVRADRHRADQWGLRG